MLMLNKRKKLEISVVYKDARIIQTNTTLTVPEAFHKCFTFGMT
jgi:hypothetical protein